MTKKAVPKTVEQVRNESLMLAESPDWVKVLNLNLIAELTGLQYFKLKNNLQEKYNSLTLEDKQKVIEAVRYTIKRFFLFFGNDVFILDEFNQEIRRREDLLKSQIAEVLSFDEKQKLILDKLSTIRGHEFTLEDIKELYKLG